MKDLLSTFQVMINLQLFTFVVCTLLALEFSANQSTYDSASTVEISSGPSEDSFVWMPEFTEASLVSGFKGSTWTCSMIVFSTIFGAEESISSQVTDLFCVKQLNGEVEASEIDGRDLPMRFSRVEGLAWEATLRDSTWFPTDLSTLLWNCRSVRKFT